MGVGVLVDLERALDLQLVVAQVRPVRACRDPQPEHVVRVVRQHGDHRGERHRAPTVEAHHLALVLALARAMLAAAEQQDQHAVALQLGQPVQLPVLVRELEVRQRLPDLDLAHLVAPFTARRSRYTLDSAVT